VCTQTPLSGIADEPCEPWVAMGVEDCEAEYTFDTVSMFLALLSLASHDHAAGRARAAKTLELVLEQALRPAEDEAKVHLDEPTLEQREQCDQDVGDDGWCRHLRDRPDDEHDSSWMSRLTTLFFFLGTRVSCPVGASWLQRSSRQVEHVM